MKTPYGMRAFLSEHSRGVTPAINRGIMRRSGVETVTVPLMIAHRRRRHFPSANQGDAANAVLAAVGYNFARLLAWLRNLWRALLASLLAIMLAYRRSDRSAHTAGPNA